MNASRLSIQSTPELSDEEAMRHLMQVSLYLLSLSSKQTATRGDTTDKLSSGPSTETLESVDTDGDASTPIEAENAPCCGRQDEPWLELAERTEQRDNQAV